MMEKLDQLCAEAAKDLRSDHDKHPLTTLPGDPNCICVRCNGARLIERLLEMIVELEGPPCADCGHGMHRHAHVESCRVVDCECWGFRSKK